MANTYNSNTEANTFYSNTDTANLVIDVSDLTVDTSNVANTQSSVGDVFDDGTTTLGTEFTGITNDQINADGPPEAEMVDSPLNGGNHAPQNIPDKRFHPQPVESAPDSLYKKQQAPLPLNSSGLPLLGLMGNRKDQTTKSTASTNVPTSAAQNTVGSRGSSQRGHNQRLNQSSSGKGARSGKGTVQKECSNPKAIKLLDGGAKAVVICDEETKAHKAFALKGGKDTVKVISNKAVKSGTITFVFNCCKRKPVKDKGYGEGEVDPRLAEATDEKPYTVIMAVYEKGKNKTKQYYALKYGQAPTDSGERRTQQSVTGRSPTDTPKPMPLPIVAP